MKKYYVKLGNMYLREIYTSGEYLENYFVREIDFKICNEHAYIIGENEKGIIIKITTIKLRIKKVHIISNRTLIFYFPFQNFVTNIQRI